MAGEPLKLTVCISPGATAILADIWVWNADRYGVAHADAYRSFLISQVEKLSTTFFKSQPVPRRARLSYITIRRRKRGHGHVAVFERIGESITVLYFFHTAQDWQNRLLEDQQ
jgi:plasmid stabilization system protein ParE